MILYLDLLYWPILNLQWWENPLSFFFFSKVGTINFSNNCIVITVPMLMFGGLHEWNIGFLQKVRIAALKCLACMTSLPHSVVYPHQNEVIRSLATGLDDHKRLVRKEAVIARSNWYSRLFYLHLVEQIDVLFAENLKYGLYQFMFTLFL